VFRFCVCSIICGIFDKNELVKKLRGPKNDKGTEDNQFRESIENPIVRKRGDKIGNIKPKSSNGSETMWKQTERTTKEVMEEWS